MRPSTVCCANADAYCPKPIRPSDSKTWDTSMSGSRLRRRRALEAWLAITERAACPSPRGDCDRCAGACSGCCCAGCGDAATAAAAAAAAGCRLGRACSCSPPSPPRTVSASPAKPERNPSSRESFLVSTSSPCEESVPEHSTRPSSTSAAAGATAVVDTSACAHGSHHDMPWKSSSYCEDRDGCLGRRSGLRRPR